MRLSVTTSGTLELNWNVAPTNADTASAIVKRDANGSFTAGAITASLGMEGVTTTASGNSVAGINDRGGTAVYGGGNTGVGVWGQSFGTGDMQVRGQKPGMKSFALEFFSSTSQRVS
jgi:outer membrane scaffolding protein for murein synthesis (MipA/OmpV family)